MCTPAAAVQHRRAVRSKRRNIKKRPVPNSGRCPFGSQLQANYLPASLVLTRIKPNSTPRQQAMKALLLLAVAYVEVNERPITERVERETK